MVIQLPCSAHTYPVRGLGSGRDAILGYVHQVLAMAQQVLKYLIPGGGDKRVTMDAVLRAVAEQFNLQPAQLKQKTNSWQIAHPRQIAMFLAKELTPASLPDIGREFGGKHHTTALHGINKIAEKRKIDRDLDRLIHKLTDSLS